MWTGCPGREVASLQEEIQFSVVPSTWLTFDLVADGSFSQPSSMLTMDRELTDAITERYKLIRATEKERSKLAKFARRLKRIFDQMVSLSKEDSICLLDHFLIGSNRLETMIKGDSVIDFVLVVDDRERECDLVDEVSQSIRGLVAADSFGDELRVDSSGGCYVRLDYRDGLYQAICYVLGIGKDDRFISQMESLIITRASCCEHSDSLINQYSRMLICVLKDIFRRFEGLKYLSSWLTDKLALYCASTSQKRNKFPLTLAKAFRRVFQLIASGIFLSGSSRSNDGFKEVEVKPEFLSDVHADMITTTGHWVNSLLIAGGHRIILGLEQCPTDQYGNWVFKDMVFFLGSGDMDTCYTDDHLNVADKAIIDNNQSVDLEEPEESKNDVGNNTSEKADQSEKLNSKRTMNDEDVDLLMMEYLRRSKLRYTADSELENSIQCPVIHKTSIEAPSETTGGETNTSESDCTLTVLEERSDEQLR